MKLSRTFLTHIVLSMCFTLSAVSDDESVTFKLCHTLQENNFDEALIIVNNKLFTPNELKTEDDNGRLPLCKAVQYNQYDLAQALLVTGAPVNWEDSTGETPLHISIGHRNHFMTTLLLINGANPLKKNFEGYTPLEIYLSDTKHARPSIYALMMENIMQDYGFFDDTQSDRENEASS